MTLNRFYYALLSVSLVGVQALSPCPLGPDQRESLAAVAVAVTPSQTNMCAEDFMVSMDRKNGEPSVVLLSFEPSSVSSLSKPAVLQVFARPDSKDFPPQNITVYGFTSVLNDTESVSWNTSGDILKPFDPFVNWMLSCSDNVIQEDNGVKIGTIQIRHSELVSADGGEPLQIDVTEALRNGIRTFALARMIACAEEDDLEADVPKGNILLSSSCSNDTDTWGQQYPPRIVSGPIPPPPKCTFTRGYYKIHINSRRASDYRRVEYYLTHSLKSKEKEIIVTSSWWIHKVSNSRKLWKIREDAVSGTPMTFFGVKRRSKYSYLAGSKRGKPRLGTKTDTMRIIPRELRCSQVDCENVYLVSHKRKKDGKRAYLTINIEDLSNKRVSWKYFRKVDRFNGLFQLIPSAASKKS
ncbi:hypothetical protein M9434_005628 [Picochlorum sp. BPE23]|nr:hypothetical protein M9434_005628 [Picochlorum sp. BPE23]